jgi:hypothetical protein
MGINLSDTLAHPLAAKFYELMAEVEKLPADVRQSHLVSEIAALRTKTETLINDPDFKAKMDSII